MPDVVPLIVPVPDVLDVPLVEPVVEPAVDPVELVPYGSDDELLLVVLLPIVTLVRMNCASEDELRSDVLPAVLPLVLPVVLPVSLPDVPVVPSDAAALAGVTQPVSVIVRPSRFESLSCPIWLDVLGLVWPLVVG